MSKFVYIVTGTEDGTIGVYGSRARAESSARQHLEGGGEIQLDGDKDGWYSVFTTSWGTTVVERYVVE